MKKNINRRNKKGGYPIPSLLTVLLIFIGNIGSQVIINNPVNIQYISISETSPLEVSIPPSSAAQPLLYAEQIAVRIASSHSQVRQSFISNDSSILHKIDLSDPAFLSAILSINLWNGIESSFSPTAMDSIQRSIFTDPTSYFSGFIYYDTTQSQSSARNRRDRAITILKDALEMDIILQNASESSKNGYYYPFVAHQPLWSQYLDLVIPNVPIGGYWDCFNQSYVTSPKYLSKYSLSSSLVFVKAYDMLYGSFGNISSNELNLNYDLSAFDTSALIADSLNSLADGISGNSGPGSNSQSRDINLGGMDMNAFSRQVLSQLTNIIIFSVQYDGNPSGITPKKGVNGQYDFNLFKCLNSSARELVPSQRIYNQLLGLVLTGITIELYSAEVVTINPEHFYFSEYNIQRIQDALFLTSSNQDISSISEYSFKTSWSSNSYLSRLMIVPENLVNQSDPINLIQMLGVYGFPMLLGGLLNPITVLNFTFEVFDYDPGLQITKNISLASFVDFPTNNVQLTVKNIGERTIWGLEINMTLFSALFSMAVGNVLPLDLNLELRNDPSFYLTPAFLSTLRNTYGFDIDAMFSKENPHFFLIDTMGNGLYSNLYPDLNDPRRVLPYSEEFVRQFIQIQGELAVREPRFIPEFGVALSFDSKESIFNPENWKLDPNEGFSFNITNLNETNSRTYTSYYSPHIVDRSGYSPQITIGTQIGTTSITMGTKQLDDNFAWNIGSEFFQNEHQFQSILLYENQTVINAIGKSVDAISIDWNYSSAVSFRTDSIQFELYNYITDRFELIPIGYVNVTTHGYNFTWPTAVKNSFVFGQNNTIMMRVTLKHHQSFQVAVDSLKLHLLDLNLNVTSLNPSRIAYTTIRGHNIYTIGSNPLLLANDECSILRGFAQLNKTKTTSGEVVIYSLLIRNIGNQPAYNISVSIPQPGPIYDLKQFVTIKTEKNISRYVTRAGDFSVDNGVLNFSIPYIDPQSTIYPLRFWFYVPNSQILPNAIIKWDDYFDRDIDDFDFSTYCNEVFVSAPLLYSNPLTTPFVHNLALEFQLNNSLSPRINQTFQAVLKIQNLGALTLYGLGIPTPNNIKGLSRIGDIQSLFYSLAPLEIIYINMTFNKTSEVGYYIPQFSSISGIEDNAIRIRRSSPFIAGRFDLKISKILSQYDCHVGDVIRVQVLLENNGTIELKNIIANDFEGYTSDQIQILQGQRSKSIQWLNPTESSQFNYTLSVNKEGYYNLSFAEAEYYFVYKNTVHNLPVILKVRDSGWIQYLPLYLPIILGILVILGTYLNKVRGISLDDELERRSLLNFGKNAEESHAKRNLKEFLDNDTKKMDLLTK